VVVGVFVEGEDDQGFVYNVGVLRSGSRNERVQAAEKVILVSWPSLRILGLMKLHYRSFLLAISLVRLTKLLI